MKRKQNKIKKEMKKKEKRRERDENKACGRRDAASIRSLLKTGYSKKRGEKK